MRNIFNNMVRRFGKSVGIVLVIMLAFSAWFVVFSIGLFAFTGLSACDIDGCNLDGLWWKNIVFIVALFGPPTVVSILWVLNKVPPDK